MLGKDFNWCFNHENLFRYWLYFRYDCIHSNELDPATIFDLWQEAKKYALEIASSKEPVLFYWTKMDYWIAESRRHIFWLSDSCQQASLLLKFLNSMLASSKNKKLELFADIGDNVFIDYVIKWKKDPNSKFELDTKPFYGMIHPLLMPGQIESDYDYSLPDGGIKETETDETQTKTDAGTKTITETETDGSVKLPDVLDTDEFKNLLSLAKENGLIKEVDGKLEWIQIGDYGGSSQLAYFLGMAFGYKHSVNGNIGNQFPGKELDELFGVKRIYRLLVQVHEAPKPQKWRMKIDEFFKKNSLLVRRDLTLSSSSSEGIA